MSPGTRVSGRVGGLPASGLLVLDEQNTAVAVPSTGAVHRVKQLTENQMFISVQTTGQSPPPDTLPNYISWYINGYG